MRVRSVIVSGALCAGAILGLAAPTLASAATTHPDSTNYHGLVSSFATSVPCNPGLGAYLVTTTANGQVHSTANANGFWITATDAGTFAAVPVVIQLDGNGQPIVDSNGNFVPVLDQNGAPVTRAGETFTGHFQDWFGGSFNRNVSEITSTSNINGTGSAGTTFKAHDNQHIVTAGPGDPFDPSTPIRRAFDHATCR